MESFVKSQSIKYITLIKDVTKKISELESIGIDMKPYKDKLNKIKNETDNKDKNNECQYDFIDTNAVTEKMSESLYSKKIEELEFLIIVLQEKYENYYVSSKKSSYIQDRLNEENIDITDLVGTANVLLEKIESMPTDDYKIQEPIINSIYKAVYNVMKLESLYQTFHNNSIILSKVNKSDIHSFYISKQIEEECNMSQNKQVLDKYNQLKTASMNNNIIINNELLRLLALDTEKECITNFKEKALKNIEDYKRAIQELKITATRLNDSAFEYNKYSKRTRKDQIKLLKRLSFILASLGITGTICFSTVKEMKKEADLYNTHTIEYDIQTGEAKDSYSWEIKKKNNALLKEEEPWEYNEDTKEYSKNFNEYSFNLDDVEDPNSYLKMINENNLSDSDTQTTKEKPDNFGNEQKKYNLTFKEYGEEHKGQEDDMLFYGIFVVPLIALMVSLIEIILYTATFKIQISKEGKIGILNDYEHDKKSKLLAEKGMNEIIKELQAMIDKCNNLLVCINNPVYYNLYPELKELLDEVNTIIGFIDVDYILDKYVPNLDKDKVLSLKK